MKCKVRLMYTVELSVEGESEEAIQDWLNRTTPEEAYFLADGSDVKYDEEIVCVIGDDSKVNYVIEEEE